MLQPTCLASPKCKPSSTAQDKAETFLEAVDAVSPALDKVHHHKLPKLHLGRRLHTTEAAITSHRPRQGVQVDIVVLGRRLHTTAAAITSHRLRQGVQVDMVVVQRRRLMVCLVGRRLRRLHTTIHQASAVRKAATRRRTWRPRQEAVLPSQAGTLASQVRTLGPLSQADPIVHLCSRARHRRSLERPTGMGRLEVISINTTTDTATATQERLSFLDLCMVFLEDQADLEDPKVGQAGQDMEDSLEGHPLGSRRIPTARPSSLVRLEVITHRTVAGVGGDV